MKITHMKFPIRMEIDDPFETMGDLILRDFYANGWYSWKGIKYENENQLELFDTTEFQKWDRFGRPYDKPKSVYIEKSS